MTEPTMVTDGQTPANSQPNTPASSSEPSAPVVPAEPKATTTDTIPKVETVDDGYQNPLTVDSSDGKADATPKEEKAVEYTDFVVPEGVEMDTELINNFKSTAKDLGLSQEQAQKLVDFQVQVEQKRLEVHNNEMQEIRKDLQQQTKQMLGPDYKKELAYVAKALTLVDDNTKKDLIEVMNKSGLGDYPSIIKFFHTVGKRISQDKFVEGIPNSRGTEDPAIRLGQSMLKK